MTKKNEKRQNKSSIKTQGKNKSTGKRDSRGKKQAPLSAEDLDRQLFSYMGEPGKKVVLDEQLDSYFKKSE
jgi:hypothetical protein